MAKKNPQTTALVRHNRINEIMRRIVTANAEPSDLAEEFGVSVRQINLDIAEAIRLTTLQLLENTEQYRAIHHARLEDMYNVIRGRMQEKLDANTLTDMSLVNLMHTLIRVEEQHAKLMGLYTTKLDIRKTLVRQEAYDINDTTSILTILQDAGALPQLDAPTVEAQVISYESTQNPGGVNPDSR
jgi:hypothetical protein